MYIGSSLVNSLTTSRMNLRNHLVIPIARKYSGGERKEQEVGRRRELLLILPSLSSTLQPLTLTLFMTTSAPKTSSVSQENHHITRVIVNRSSSGFERF